MKLLQCSCLNRVDIFFCHMYNLCSLRVLVLNQYLGMLEMCPVQLVLKLRFLENLTVPLK